MTGFLGRKLEKLIASEMDDDVSIAAKFAPLDKNGEQIPVPAPAKPKSGTMVGSMTVTLTGVLERQCKTVVDAEQALRDAQEHLRQAYLVMGASIVALGYVLSDPKVTEAEHARAQDALSFGETLRGNAMPLPMPGVPGS